MGGRGEGGEGWTGISGEGVETLARPAAAGSRASKPPKTEQELLWTFSIIGLQWKL